MSDVAIALNRFGLGGRPDERAPAEPRRWLAEQLQRFDSRPPPIAALPATATIASGLADYLAELRMERQSAPGAQRRGAVVAERPMGATAAGDAQMGPPGRNAAPAVEQAREAARQQRRAFYVNAVGARAEAALVSPSPFVERLVHFWANHFAVSADKLVVTGLAGQLEFDAIRPHVLGSFREMLHAVERHPAMLLYLDQAQSIGPNSVAGQLVARRRGQGRGLGLNENLAREIMELHTLGARTGYTQADVTEFARALTGWSVAGLVQGRRARFAGIDGAAGAFVFAERLHEPGSRTILGRTWTQRGEDQAAAVLDMLATHPATARHVATKLARHFAADDPPPALVARLEADFLRSGGDLPSLYRTLVQSPECWSPQPAKFKTPWEWSISAMRALGAKQARPMATLGLQRQLGQPTWQPGSPAGWDDVAGSWAGPDAVMRRVEAAERMAQRVPDTIDARARAVQLFPGALGPATVESIARAESPAQGLALMLVAPEFMRR